MNEQKLSILISDCIANKRKAQQELYLLFYADMFRLCMRYLRSDDLVAEALNTGFLKVFTGIRNYSEGKGKLKTWISAIMIRSCIDLQRSEMRFQHHDSIAETDDSPQLSAAALDRLYASDLMACIRILPQASQLVFNLYEVDGYSHAEIAVMLGISQSTSRWHLSSAKQQLRELINKRS